MLSSECVPSCHLSQALGQPHLRSVTPSGYSTSVFGSFYLRFFFHYFVLRFHLSLTNLKLRAQPQSYSTYLCIPFHDESLTLHLIRSFIFNLTQNQCLCSINVVESSTRNRSVRHVESSSFPFLSSVYAENDLTSVKCRVNIMQL